MPYDLRFFDNFITEQFAPGRSIRPADYPHLKRQLLDHARHVKNKLDADTTSCTSHEQLELCVRNYQTIICAVLDRLEDTINFGPEPDVYGTTDEPGILNLARHIYMSLETLIFHLHTYFPPYFDFSAGLPKLYWRVRSQDIKANGLFLTGLLKKAGVGEELLKIIEVPVRVFSDHWSCRRATFHQLFYLKDLLDDISALTLGPSAESTLLLLEVLQNRDFNAPVFRDYCTERFSKQLDASASVAERNQMLLMLLGKNARLFPLPGRSWMPGLPPLKEMLAQWLEDQLDALKGKGGEEPVPEQSSPPDPAAKIQSVMTVAQMAHMLRLMMETGVYVNVPTGDAIKMHSRNFSTRQQPSISPENFRQKYYTPDSPTAATVRDLLMKMIRHSKKLAP